MKNKEIKKTMVPQLRFPEFRDTGKWDEKSLGEISKLVTEKAGNRKYTLISINSGIGLISQIEKFGREIAGDSYRNYIVIRKEDFAYNKSSTKYYPEGQISMLENIEIGAVPNSIFTCFSVNRKIIFPYFLKYLFENNIHGKWLRNFISIGARAHGSLNVDNKDLFSLPIVSPNFSEQQKIADCLSSIDELIMAQGQKVEALIAHKKGLIQQLFPAEGETFPLFRFPEFRNARKWSYVNGNNLFDPISNKNHNSDLSILAISQEYGAIPREEINYNVIVSDKSVESYKVVEVGDFIISLRSFQGGIEHSNYKGLCSPAYIILRKKNNDVINHFFKQYFKTDLYIQNLNKNIEGIRDGKMVSYKQFSDILLPYPKPDEQRKIADCLSSIDKLIVAQSQKLEVLKAHKKGLMQQLFPYNYASI